jgi:hypothetical protein
MTLGVRLLLRGFFNSSHLHRGLLSIGRCCAFGISNLSLAEEQASLQSADNEIILRSGDFVVSTRCAARDAINSAGWNIAMKQVAFSKIARQCDVFDLSLRLLRFLYTIGLRDASQ